MAVDINNTIKFDVISDLMESDMTQNRQTQSGNQMEDVIQADSMMTQNHHDLVTEGRLNDAVERITKILLQGCQGKNTSHGSTKNARD